MKISKFFWGGGIPRPLPRWGAGHPSPHPTPLGVLGACGASLLGACGASILAPSALGVPTLIFLQINHCLLGNIMNSVVH